MNRDILEAAIKRGIATYVRNTGARVSETDLFTDVIVEVNRSFTSAELVFEAARALLDLPDLKAPAETRLQQLPRVLDRLAETYDSLEGSPVPTGEQPEPKRTEYAIMRARYAAAFPGLGTYPAILDHSAPAERPEVSLGDALDDLTDIALDLEEVLERAEASVEDALWYFRFLFETHWGAHLRWLQVYLHARER